MPFGVFRQQTSGSFKRAMVADAGEHVQDLARVASCIADAVGGEQRKLQFTRQLDRSMINDFFFTIEMSLQLDVHVLMTKDTDQPRQLIASFSNSTAPDGVSYWAGLAAGKANQAAGKFLQFALFN